MRDNGGIPENMSVEGRTLIQDLLDLDRDNEEGAQMVSPSAPVPLTPETLFPGKLRPNKRLHWGLRASNPESLGAHYNKVDFQRQLCEDKVDPAAIRACENNTQLATLWLKQRDDFHSNKTDSTTPGEPTIDGAEQRVILRIPNPPGIDSYQSSSDTSGGGKQRMKVRKNERPPVSVKSPTRNSKKKPELNDPEKNRRIALAARVGRYPLCLPGTNNDRPLTMDRKIEHTKEGEKAVPLWSTYKAKYNRNMAIQLLKDYDVLPPDIESMKNAAVFQRFVVERDLIHERKIPLHEVWTNERLEAYVADQEAKGLIPALTTAPAFALHPEIQTQLQSNDLTHTELISGTPRRKRLKEGKDSYGGSPLSMSPHLSGVDG